MIFPWNKRHNDPAPTSSLPLEERLRAALLSLGASLSSGPQVNASADGDPVCMRFDYQGAKFMAVIPDDSTLSIVLPAIHTTDAANIHEVSFLCNHLNPMAAICRPSFAIEESTNEINTSLSSTFRVARSTSDADLAQLLSDYIKAIFDFRQEWVAQFRDLIDHRSTPAPFDLEASLARKMRTLFLMRMGEALHSAEELPLAGSDSAAIPSQIPTLASYLSTLHGISAEAVSAVEIVRPDRGSTPLPLRRLETYGLLDDFWPEESRRDPAVRFAHPWMMIRVHTDSTPRQTFDILLTDYGRDGRNGYVSVTDITEGGDPAEGTEASSPRWQPQAVRQVIVAPGRSAHEEMSEFRYMLDDAREKISAGHHAELTDEQSLLMRAFISDTAYHLYHGTRLFLKGCYAQAAALLGNVFDDMMARYDKMDEEARDSFAEVCYMLGTCLDSFGNHRAAFYYLSIAVNHGNYIHDREYIDCLTRTRDYRAQELVESALKEYDNFIRENGDNIPPQAHEMYQFIRRRQAYILVESGRLDEAETLLTAMIDEEQNREFAIDELAYIRRLREQK